MYISMSSQYVSNESKEVNKDEEMDVLLGDHFFNIAARGRQHSHAHTYTTHTLRLEILY